MQIIPLGKIAPATAGTPQQVTPDRTILAAKIIVSQVAGTTGATHFGTSTLNRSTLAGVIKTFLAPGSSGFADTFIIEAPGNVMQVADYWVDAANNGEGLLVSYVKQ